MCWDVCGCESEKDSLWDVWRHLLLVCHVRDFVQFFILFASLFFSIFLFYFIFKCLLFFYFLYIYLFICFWVFGISLGLLWWLLGYCLEFYFQFNAVIFVIFYVWIYRGEFFLSWFCLWRLDFFFGLFICSGDHYCTVDDRGNDGEYCDEMKGNLIDEFIFLIFIGNILKIYFINKNLGDILFYFGINFLAILDYYQCGYWVRFFLVTDFVSILYRNFECFKFHVLFHE